MVDHLRRSGRPAAGSLQPPMLQATCRLCIAHMRDGQLHLRCIGSRAEIGRSQSILEEQDGARRCAEHAVHSGTGGECFLPLAVGAAWPRPAVGKSLSECPWQRHTIRKGPARLNDERNGPACLQVLSEGWGRGRGDPQVWWHLPWKSPLLMRRLRPKSGSEKSPHRREFSAVTVGGREGRSGRLGGGH